MWHNFKETLFIFSQSLKVNILEKYAFVKSLTASLVQKWTVKKKKKSPGVTSVCDVTKGTSHFSLSLVSDRRILAWLRMCAINSNTCPL